MGLWQRAKLVFRARANRALDRMENPADALDLAYEKQLEALQRVRRGIADVVTAQKQLEIQARQIESNRTRLDTLARRALEQNREEVAASALTQSELVEGQLQGLRVQIEALTHQRENLEVAGERLQARVASMRTQKETLKAQYSAAQATVHAGETTAGISKEMDEVQILLERARDKMLSTQARAEAVNELADTGVLGRLGAGGVEALEAQVRAHEIGQTVDQRLAAMKEELGLGAPGDVARIEAAPQTETDSSTSGRNGRRLRCASLPGVPDIIVSDPRDDADFEKLIDIDAQGFGGSRELSARWAAAAREHERFRIARAGDDVVGMYALIRAGQFYGGESVPVDCVLAVAVHPLWRRRGVAGALMRDLVNVSRDTGAALAPLYAATISLYRRWGWEVVDRAVHHDVRTAALSDLRGDGEPVADPAPSDIEALRRSYLPYWDGPLDRPDWWLKVEWLAETPGEHLFVHGWTEGGRLTGFVRYRYTSNERVVVEEFHATTADALRGLLGLLAGNESLHQEISFHACVPERSDLLYVLDDASKSVHSKGGICWMQRIVDVPAALRARGWSPRAEGRVDLAVEDPVSGSTPFVLEMARGRATVTDGGDGKVQCGVGALSAWYAGALRAVDAERIGLMRGDVTDLQTMDDFIDRRPVWMPDHF